VKPKLGKKGSFRRLVQDWRERTGQAQGEAAKALGVSSLDTFQNWEQGRNEPNALVQRLLKPILEKL